MSLDDSCSEFIHYPVDLVAILDAQEQLAMDATVVVDAVVDDLPLVIADPLSLDVVVLINEPKTGPLDWTLNTEQYAHLPCPQASQPVERIGKSLYPQLH